MKTKKGVLARMLTYTRPYGIYLVFALVFAVLQVLLTLYAPVLSGRAVDFIVGPGNVDFPAIGEILIQFAVVILLSAGFQWLMALCTNIVTGNTVRDIREAAFGKLETIPLSYIDGAARGDLMSRVVTDVDMISDGLLQGFSQLFTGVVTVFGTIGFMLSLSPAIAAVVVVLTPVSLFVSSFIARGVSRSFREQSTIRGRLGGFVEEMLGSQSVVKAFGYEQRAQARFDEVNEHLNKVGLRAQFFSAMVNPAPALSTAWSTPPWASSARCASLPAACLWAACRPSSSTPTSIPSPLTRYRASSPSCSPPLRARGACLNCSMWSPNRPTRRTQSRLRAAPAGSSWTTCPSPTAAMRN